MSRLIRYLRGSVRFRLTGAAPEQCLNALAAARLEFWDIEREDVLHLSLCVPAREAERLQGLALRCLCTAEVTERSGLRAQFGGLLRRPVLLLGLLAAAAATFVLQEFVWTIEVEGNDRLPAGQIVQEHVGDDIAVVLRAAEFRARVGRKALDLPVGLLHGGKGNMLARGDGRKSVMPSLLEIVLRNRAGQPGLAERLQLQAEAFRKRPCADAGRVEALNDLNSRINKRGRAERGDIGAQIAVGIERMDDGEHGALQLRLQRQALRLKLQMGRQVLAVGDGVPVGKIRLHVLRILARGGMPAGGEIVKQTHARRGSAFQCGIFQQSGIDIGLQLAYVQL